jgi:trimethylamine corrinoid protein
MEETLKKVYEAVLSYDTDGAEKAALKALEAGADPLKVVEKATEAIKKVGDRFGSGEVFLVELIIAGEAMGRVTSVLQPEIERRGIETKSVGRVLIGTVEEDIHDLGKNLVITMLSVNGFEVIDLGKDVSDTVFAEKVRETKPDIVALSALMTTTMVNQRKVIERLREEGLRDGVKVLVGGAPVTARWAEEIGADGYATDAMEALAVTRKTLGIKQ